MDVNLGKYGAWRKLTAYTTTISILTAYRNDFIDEPRREGAVHSYWGGARKRFAQRREEKTMRRQHSFLCAVAALCLLCGVAHAYMFAASRLGSSLAVHDGRLYFIQADGSLTVLDMETGAVKKRLKLAGYAHTYNFEMSGDGILGIGSSGAFMVDRDGGMKWQHRGRSALRLDDRIVFSDGDHTLSAVDIATGRVLWENNLGGYVEFDSAGGIVYGLCNFSTVKDKSAHFLVALDAETGKELWRKATPLRQYWGMLRCTENRAVVAAGRFEEKGFGTYFDRILSWTRDGDEMPALTPNPEIMGQPSFLVERAPISLLVDGVKLPKREMRDQGPERRELTPDERRRIGNARADSGLALADGGIVATAPVADFRRGDAVVPDLELYFLDGGNQWRGIPAYMNLHARNNLETAVSTADAVVVASRLGHVECLDRKTGRSRWLYVYPTLRPEISGPHKWKAAVPGRSYYTDDMRRYRAETAGVGVGGTTVDGDPYPPDFRLTLDPDPVDYYAEDEKIGRVLSFAVVAFILLAAVAGLVDLYYFLAKRKPAGFMAKLDAGEKPGTLALFCVMGVFASIVAYYFFGRYSFLVSVCLRALPVFLLGLGACKLAASLRGREENFEEKLGKTVVFALFLALSAGVVLLIVGNHY